jgi:hypothetical protein
VIDKRRDRKNMEAVKDNPLGLRLHGPRGSMPRSSQNYFKTCRIPYPAEIAKQLSELCLMLDRLAATVY